MRLSLSTLELLGDDAPTRWAVFMAGLAERGWRRGYVHSKFLLFRFVHMEET